MKTEMDNPTATLKHYAYKYVIQARSMLLVLRGEE